MRALPDEPYWRFTETVARDYATRYTPIVLEPLNDGRAAELVDQLLESSALPDHLRRLILDKAEGNPFFVE